MRTRYAVRERTLETGGKGEDDWVRVHANGRRGAAAALEVSGYVEDEMGSIRIPATRISLCAFLRALGLTAEDCAAALAAEEEGARG